MIWLALSLALIAIAAAGIVWARRRARRRGAVLVPVELIARVDAATTAFARAAPWQPASEAGAPAAAAAIEAALIARDPKRALEAAETALAASPDDGAARVLLAWALCANAQPTAAADQLARAGAAAGRALALYLAARIEHLRFEHASGATGAVPPLVTTADLAVVTLASGRGAATWLQGTTETQLSAAQARAAIDEHRAITSRCLERAVAALEAAPGFADAAYLVARLAVKAGLVPAARTLFVALAPRMAGRPDAAAFERDRGDLDNPAGAVAAAKQPPLPDKAKRSRSLKVLS
jgi:hypothetical protein